MSFTARNSIIKHQALLPYWVITSSGRCGGGSYERPGTISDTDFYPLDAMDRPLLFRSAADMLYNLLHDKSSAGDKSATSKRAESNWPTLTTLQVHDVSATNLQQIKVGLMDFEPMLARYCYGRVSVCLSVCLSVTSRCSFETCGWIEPVFGVEASSAVSCTVQ